MSCQGEPRGNRGELFVLRPRSAKGAAELGNFSHQLSALETENRFGAVQEFFFFDSEIAEAAARACVEKCLAEKFTVRRVYQRMGSKNLVQSGKHSARGKEQAATREFQPLFLQLGLNIANRAISQPPRLGLHPRDEFAALTLRHLFCGVIGLAEFIREGFDQVEPLPRKHDR